MKYTWFLLSFFTVHTLSLYPMQKSKTLCKTAKHYQDKKKPRQYPPFAKEDRVFCNSGNSSIIEAIVKIEDNKNMPDIVATIAINYLTSINKLELLNYSINIYTNFTVSCLALNDAGKQLAIGGSDPNKHYILHYEFVETKHGKACCKKKCYTTPCPLQAVAFSPNSKHLLVVFDEEDTTKENQCNAIVFNLITGQSITELNDYSLSNDKPCYTGWLDNKHVMVHTKQKAMKWSIEN